MQENLDSLIWTHSLKPNNSGLPAFKDTRCDYSEIAILQATLRSRQNCSRLIELIHRSIPYPVVLVTIDERGSHLSLAPKRASEAEAGQVVIEDRVESTGFLDSAASRQLVGPFLQSLSLDKQPATDLKALYLGWLRCILSFLAAELTGRLAPDSLSPQEVREALDARKSIETEMTALRSQAKRATQISRQVELNLQIKELEKALESLTTRL